MFLPPDRVLPSFREALEGRSLGELEMHPQVVYGLDEDLTLAYMNPAWLCFAEANGATSEFGSRWSLGAAVLDAIEGPSRRFVEEGFRSCLLHAQPWTHEYECSSVKSFRRFRMSVSHLASRGCLLVVHSLLVSGPHGPTGNLPHPPIDERYREGSGMIIQCAHCRRFRRAGEQPVWDWVPAWAGARPENTSGSFCESCFRRHFPHATYPEERIHSDGVP